MKFIVKEWNGVEIPEKDVERMLKELAKTIKNTPDESIFYTLTGDTMILGLREDFPDEEYIELFVAKIYAHASTSSNDDFFEI